MEIAQHTSKGLAGEEQAFSRYGDVVPTGDHWRPDIQFTPDDLAHLEKVGKVAGGFGTAIDLAVSLYEINNGVPPLEVASKLGGGMAGAWAGGYAGAWAGAMFGPPGVFIGALIGGAGGAYLGEWGGEQGYQVATR